MHYDRRISFLLTLFIIIGSIGNAQIRKHDIIPDFIIQKSDEFLKSKVGDKFFETYTWFDSTKSKYRKSYSISGSYFCSKKLKNPHYLLCYNFHIPEKGVDLVTIEFITDTLGQLISECYKSNLPDCPKNNCWDNFPIISKIEAISIANKSAFEKGLKEWLITFQYEEIFNKYVWEIQNYLTLKELNNSEVTSGEILYINSEDGSIVRKDQYVDIE